MGGWGVLRDVRETDNWDGKPTAGTTNRSPRCCLPSREMQMPVAKSIALKRSQIKGRERIH